MGPFNCFLLLANDTEWTTQHTMGEILRFGRFPMTNYMYCKILSPTKRDSGHRDGTGRCIWSLVGPVIRNMLFVHALLSARSVYGNIIREQQFIIIQRWWPFGFFFRFFAILLVGVSHCLLPKTTRWHRPRTRVFANEWVKVWRTIRTNGKRW